MTDPYAAYTSLSFDRPDPGVLRVTLDGPGLNFKPNLDARSLTYIRTRKPDVAILPLLQNASGGRWYGAELGKLLADPGGYKGEAFELIPASRVQVNEVYTASADSPLIRSTRTSDG